mgnify:CR=1 FL=1
MNVSQDRLSKLADITYNTIIKIESGANKNPHGMDAQLHPLGRGLGRGRRRRVCARRRPRGRRRAWRLGSGVLVSWAETLPAGSTASAAPDPTAGRHDTMCRTERWLRGRKHLTANEARVYALHEFESHRLRQIQKHSAVIALCCVLFTTSISSACFSCCFRSCYF